MNKNTYKICILVVLLIILLSNLLILSILYSSSKAYAQTPVVTAEDVEPIEQKVIVKYIHVFTPPLSRSVKPILEPESEPEKIEEVEPEPEPEPEVVEEIIKEPVKFYTDDDAIVIAKMLWGECRGIKDQTLSDGSVISGTAQKAAVVWSVLNRYDAEYEDSIIGVVTAPGQYHGYKESYPVDEELLDITYDVLDRWNREKNGETEVGRVLPSDYMWFHGDGKYNHFRNAFKTENRWNWSLGDPYI